MMATLPHPTTMPVESDDFVLITHATLRFQLLQARQINEFYARSIIQRGESVYLSLREIPDAAERQAINWAILRLQMGAQLSSQELPEPLRAALSSQPAGPSPLIQALIWGSLGGVVGGVLMMAIVGLAIIVLNVPTESNAGVMATAVAFVLSSAFIGVSLTIYFWRKLSQ